MLNIHELEKRYFHYKLKSYIPYIIIFFSLTVIAGILLIFNNIDTSSQDTEKVEIKNIPKKTLEIKKEEKVAVNVEQKKEVILQEISNSVVIDNNIKTTKTTDIKENESKTLINEKLTLTPSMDFINKIDRNPSASPTYKEPIKKEKSLPKQEAKTTVKEVQKPKAQHSRQLLSQGEKSSIQIKKNNTYDDIQHVIKRFKKNNNPALSLFIAKKYYELGEYKKSYNYALRTNEINNNIEASWIIFAKSLVKLDRKDMAIKTLKKYISHSDSNKAKILLDEITSGKLNAN